MYILLSWINPQVSFVNEHEFKHIYLLVWPSWIAKLVSTCTHIYCTYLWWYPHVQYGARKKKTDLDKISIFLEFNIQKKRIGTHLRMWDDTSWSSNVETKNQNQRKEMDKEEIIFFLSRGTSHLLVSIEFTKSLIKRDDYIHTITIIPWHLPFVPQSNLLAKSPRFRA